ncbi:MAG: hypothetical protein QOK49_1138 [Baekduia sp.]|nr:hypothetical protein [Baekduia sp.]
MKCTPAAEPSAVLRAHAEPAAAPGRDASRGRAARLARSPWAMVAGLYALVAAVYTVLSLHTPLPVLFPDEFRYSHLARSLADGHGFDWRGKHVDQTAALYSYVITPAYMIFHSTVDAWRASKILGTLALCTQLVPVWLLGRELFDSNRLALIPAVLSVAGTWMLSSAQTATEVLAFPLATTALCAAVAALRHPGSRWGWLALALLLLGTWARIQVAVLVPALLCAFVIDVLRDPAQRRARLRAHRPYLLAAGVGVVLLTIVALAVPAVTGDYGQFFKFRPALSRILQHSGLQLLELTVVAGVVPVLLAVAAACSRAAWRDDRAGPLLAVFWPAAVATVLQTGFFLAAYTPADWAIGRYVTYAVPIALVLATTLMLRPRLLTRVSLGVAGVLSLGLLARPAIKMMGEERASWGTTYHLDNVLGTGTGVSLALVALVLLAVVVVLRRRAAPARAAVVLALAVGAVFAVQDQASWWQMFRTASSFRSVMPADLEWVDHHAGGPVALLGITQNAPQFDDVDFFNRSVTQAYGPAEGLAGRAVEGKTCPFHFDVAGLLQVSPDCGPVPHRLLINDPAARVTLHDEIASASDPNWGRIIEVAPATTPRAQSLIVLPCPRRTPGYSGERPDIIPATAPISCRAALTGALWLDAPAQVRVSYRGGPRPQRVTVGSRSWTIPADRDTTIGFAAARGYSQFSVQQDWTSSAGTPQVRSVALVRGGTTTPLT